MNLRTYFYLICVCAFAASAIFLGTIAKADCVNTKIHPAELREESIFACTIRPELKSALTPAEQDFKFHTCMDSHDCEDAIAEVAGNKYCADFHDVYGPAYVKTLEKFDGAFTACAEIAETKVDERAACDRSASKKMLSYLARQIRIDTSKISECAWMK